VLAILDDTVLARGAHTLGRAACHVHPGRAACGPRSRTERHPFRPTSRVTTSVRYDPVPGADAALAAADREHEDEARHQPVRRRLSTFAARLARRERGSPDDVLRAFGNRMAQPLPSMSCSSSSPKSLRHALALDAADVWTGSGGVLERVASDRDAGEGRLALMAAEESAVVRCSCVYGLVDD
jgi:hypothetical protein